MAYPIPNICDHEVVILDKFGNMFVAQVESVYREGPSMEFERRVVSEPKTNVTLSLRMHDPRHLIVSEESMIKEPKQIGL